MRSNWKTKNWNPNEDPTQYDSSSDSEDLASQNAEEARDRVLDSPDQNMSNFDRSATKENGVGDYDSGSF